MLIFTHVLGVNPAVVAPTYPSRTPTVYPDLSMTPL